MDESPAPEKRFFVEVDGTRYGPATVAILQEWVTAGRVTPDSMLIEEGTGALIRASALPQLLWNATTGMTPPPPEGYAHAPGKSTSVWLLVIGGCGVFGCLGLIILLAILVPVFTQARKAAQRTVEMSRMKRLNVCLLLYATDYDDKLPPVMDNLASLKPYLRPFAAIRNAGDDSPDVLSTPLPSGGEVIGNKLLAGKSIDEVDDQRSTVMLYDSKPFLNKNIVGYVDGHVTTVTPQELREQLSENPFVKAK
jgi:hypothetical protein